MDETKKEPWESLAWGRRNPGIVELYERQGMPEMAEKFREMEKKHKRWLKSDQGRRELGEEQMFERPAMADLHGRHLEYCLENLREKCEKMREDIENSKEDGELDFFGIDEFTSNEWMQMLAKIAFNVEEIEEMCQYKHEIYDQYFWESHADEGYDDDGDPYDGRKHLDLIMTSLWDGYYELVGFNPYKDDYQGWPMGTSMSRLRDAAREKVKRLTKDKMISLYTYCINFTLAFMNLQFQMKAVEMAMYLAKGDRAQLLNDIATMEDMYEQLDATRTPYGISCDSEAERKFNRACADLLDECWLA